MAERDDNERQSLMHIILEGMPPLVKAGVFSSLAIPLVLSISALLLNVNIGVLIEKAIDTSRGQTVDIVGTLVADQVNGLSGQLSAMQVEQARQSAELRASVQGVIRELAAFNSRVDGLEKRIESVVRDVGRLKFAFCDTDKLPHEACVLKD